MHAHLLRLDAVNDLPHVLLHGGGRAGMSAAVEAFAGRLSRSDAVLREESTVSSAVIRRPAKVVPGAAPLFLLDLAREENRDPGAFLRDATAQRSLATPDLRHVIFLENLDLAPVASQRDIRRLADECWRTAVLVVTAVNAFAVPRQMRERFLAVKMPRAAGGAPVGGAKVQARVDALLHPGTRPAEQERAVAAIAGLDSAAFLRCLATQGRADLADVAARADRRLVRSGNWTAVSRACALEVLQLL